MAYGIKRIQHFTRQSYLKSRTAVGQVTSRLGYHVCPSVMILGAQKSGTSAIAAYLNRHPQVRLADRKELNHFNVDARYAKGLAGYHARFPLPFQMPKNGIAIDATSAHLYGQAVPARIHEYDPSTRLIAMVRDPVKRAYSQWNMYRNLNETRHGRADLAMLMDRLNHDSAAWVRRLLGGELPSFADAVEEEMALMETSNPPAEPSFLRRGLYLEQIQRYLEYFPRDQLHVIHMADMRHNAAGVMDEVTNFLGLQPMDWAAQQFPQVHARPYAEPMPKETEVRLRAFFAEPDARLFEFLGRGPLW